MINRIVMMKLSSDADSAVIARMQDYVARIGAELDEPIAYHMAPNVAAVEGGYNWMLHAVFANEDDMSDYREAPLHCAFVDYCEPFTEDYMVACYELPAE